jgi:hypothetical protein
VVVASVNQDARAEGLDDRLCNAFAPSITMRMARLGLSPRSTRSASSVPASATADSNRLVATRALRRLDGAVSVLLPSYLSALGFGATQIGIIVFGPLFGFALVTLWARTLLLKQITTVGAGFTGVSAARVLAERGASVAVLDAQAWAGARRRETAA